LWFIFAGEDKNEAAYLPKITGFPTNKKEEENDACKSFPPKGKESHKTSPLPGNQSRKTSTLVEKQFIRLCL